MPTFPHIQTVVDKLCIEYIEEILYITVYGGHAGCAKVVPCIGGPPGNAIENRRSTRRPCPCGKEKAPDSCVLYYQNCSPTPQLKCCLSLALLERRHPTAPHCGLSTTTRPVQRVNNNRQYYLPWDNILLVTDWPRQKGLSQAASGEWWAT